MDDGLKSCVVPLVSLAIWVVFGLVGFFTSSEIFHSQSYRNLVDIPEGSFAEDTSTNISEISVIDVATARRLGDRTIAELENPSWYEVADEYNLITYQGTQYRISPINYGDFFKFLSAQSTGIPGYVLVNSVTQEAELVVLDEPIKYSPSASFSQNLRRHLRSQFPNSILGTSFFEIDEEGNPYWITSIKEATIGLFGGQVETAFIITNASSGESAVVYSVEEIPEWVDHAFDLDYLMTLVYYNYEYINGFFNFSSTGINRTSYYYKDGSFDGYNTTVLASGEIAFYTGVTPANAAESINGFLFLSPRTGKITFYSCYGAEESSAQAAAQGLVQNLGYSASFPTIVNVENIPTYFMVLKDSAGLIQRYALCNVENYTIVVQSSSLEEAIDLYRSELASAGTITIEEELPQEDVVEYTTTSGEIDFLYTVEIDGYTHFCFTLVGDNNLYISSIENSYRQVLLTVGTEVTVTFSIDGDVAIVSQITS